MHPVSLYKGSVDSLPFCNTFIGHVYSKELLEGLLLSFYYLSPLMVDTFLAVLGKVTVVTSKTCSQ